MISLLQQIHIQEIQLTNAFSAKCIYDHEPTPAETDTRNSIKDAFSARCIHYTSSIIAKLKLNVSENLN